LGTRLGGQGAVLVLREHQYRVPSPSSLIR
jgi:hypothetical protein